jgi:predicted O-methyltransferase YrrM
MKNVTKSKLLVEARSKRLKRMRSLGQFEDLEGNIFKITGAIEAEEIEFLEALIDEKVGNVLDIGVGKGVSAALFVAKK